MNFNGSRPAYTKFGLIGAERFLAVNKRNGSRIRKNMWRGEENLAENNATVFTVDFTGLKEKKKN